MDSSKSLFVRISCFFGNVWLSYSCLFRNGNQNQINDQISKNDEAHDNDTRKYIACHTYEEKSPIENKER